MIAFHSIFSIQNGPPLFYLHGKKLENGKKLMLVQIMSSKNIVNNVGIFNDSATVNSNLKGIILG